MKSLLKILICIALISGTGLQAQSNVAKDSVQRLNRHDFVKRGNHPNEFNAGDYVIVGTTLSETDAMLMVKQLEKLKYPEPSYAYLTDKSFWYIYYGSYKDIEEAKSKRDELRKYKMYKNARLLTVFEGTVNNESKLNRHEFMQRGSSPDEFELGSYVIVGAFSNKSEAQHAVEELKKLDFKDAAYGYLSAKKSWYIHFGRHDDIDVVKAERDKYQKLEMFQYAWLLTVHQ